MTVIYLESGRVERVDFGKTIAFLATALRLSVAEVKRRISAGYILETSNALFVR
jgi:hypothetical protein